MIDHRGSTSGEEAGTTWFASKWRRRPANSVLGATRAAFAAVGFGMAAWAPLVPYAKLRIGADDGDLGLLLLCLGIGSFATLPLSGALAGRFGCRNTILTASVCLAACLPLLAVVDRSTLLALTLLLFGAALGAADVAMNVQAVMVEQASRRPVMSGFHAFFSIGGIVGAGGISLALWFGATPLTAASVAAVLLVVGLLPFGRHMLPRQVGSGRQLLFARPTGPVLVIGCLCFIAFLTEGAMLDWSGVFLIGARHTRPAGAGAGYAVFNGAMALGRLSGDALTRHFGPQRLVAGGALCAMVGLLLIVGVDVLAAALFGFALVGLGLANLVPALFSALGRQQAMAPNLAIAAASTLGYAGILIGPAFIGLIARVSSLSVAFLFVCAMLFGVAVSSAVVSRQRA